MREDFSDWNRIRYSMALAEHLERVLAAGGIVPADDAELNAMLDALKPDPAR